MIVRLVKSVPPGKTIIEIIPSRDCQIVVEPREDLEGSLVEAPIEASSIVVRDKIGEQRFPAFFIREVFQAPQEENPKTLELLERFESGNVDSNTYREILALRIQTKSVLDGFINAVKNYNGNNNLEARDAFSKLGMLLRSYAGEIDENTLDWIYSISSDDYFETIEGSFARGFTRSTNNQRFHLNSPESSLKS